MTDTTLTLDRLLKASSDRIWRCLTEPDLLKRWFAPAPVQTTEAMIDPRPGGIFHTVMVVPDFGEIRTAPGCVVMAEPDRRLVWTNCLGPDFAPNLLGPGPGDFGFSADIALNPESGGTRYVATVRHATADTARAHAAMGFNDGWGAATAQLDALALTL